MKTIEEYGKQLAKSIAIIKKYDHDTENESPAFLKQKKKTFNELIHNRHDQILKLSK